jgi:large subunit ribosomal protein L21
MKYLILSISGKQIVIKPNRWYDLDFIKEAKKGDLLAFKRILLYRNEETMQIGKPIISKGFIVGQVIQHIAGKKLIVLKTKPKKNYTRTSGQRKKYTRVQFATF